MDLIENRARRVLVVGLGISGIATALRLHGIGWTPVVVEKAPARRSGGYFIGLFGAGKTAAERLGLLDGVHDRTTPGTHFDIDRDGNRRQGLSFKDFPGDVWLMLRGDVERAAFAKLPPEVEVRYSTVPTKIEQDADGVDVTLTNSADGTVATERFDLVVGTDGLRSTVRSLVFGPHEKYLHRLNFMIAAFEFTGVPAGLEKGDGATLLEPGRSMWVFPFSDHDPTVLLSYRTDDVDAEFTASPAERIRARYGPEPLGRTLDDVVAAMESTDELLFDSVEQVRMDSWHRGRVVLVGDAAWCVTLYAGMGASSGLAGAQLLGTMLARHPDDLERALTEWEAGLRPYIDYYQKDGIKKQTFFTPDNRFQVGMRRALTVLNGRRVVGAPFRWWSAHNKAARMNGADITRA
ncbi:FAD-dependent monooxygenase [Saccharothrix deserti]|uniref:FAD-dependent monooxygenase n=1 Tax=Saccharothrix deserti TaxID=2593674 RepID=UPI00131D9936|nr:FAD-dependent monooxygenase [Saccharothrix deserti]